MDWTKATLNLQSKCWTGQKTNLNLWTKCWTEQKRTLNPQGRLPSYCSNITRSCAEQEIHNRATLVVHSSFSRVHLLLRVTQIIVIVKVEHVNQLLQIFQIDICLWLLSKNGFVYFGP